MILKFYAKGAQLVRVPGAQPLPKQPDMYVGRYFDPATRGYPADKEPASFDSETASGQRLMRLCRLDNCLFPADQETANACNVKFVPTVWLDGCFVEAPVKSPNKSTESK